METSEWIVQYRVFTDFGPSRRPVWVSQTDLITLDAAMEHVRGVVDISRKWFRILNQTTGEEISGLVF